MTSRRRRDVLLAVLQLCSCAATIHAQTFVVHYLEEKRIVPVRIEFSPEQQTEHVLSSTGGETLYDFSQGKVAYKDRNSSQCFLANIAEESLEGDRRRLRNLKNGVVRGFYLPTFIIQEESINDTQLWKKFGARLAQFCDGNTASVIKRRQKHRGKRETSEEKGQFTHHSYGHYGQQSNNYVHYGHETYITGSVDKDGQPRNQRVTHHQVRSESSSGYPGRSSRNGPQSSTDGSTVGISGPQMQTQYQMPSYQQTSGGNGRNFGIGGSGRFSLQTAQESGYQLNLPLGLSAGNTYRGGFRSAGQYGVGLQPQITTEYQKYPSSMYSQIYRPGDQTRFDQMSPRVSSIPGVPTSPIQTGVTPEDYTKIRDRTASPSYHDLDQTPLTDQLPGTRLGKMPTVTHPIPSTTAGERRVEGLTVVRGRETPGFQTDSRPFTPSGQRQPGTDLDDVSRDERISGHRLPPRIDHSGLQTIYPGSGVPLQGIQAPVYHPGISVPSIHAPETKVQKPLDLSRVSTTPGTSFPGPGIHAPSFHPGVGIPSIHIPSILVPSPSGTPEGFKTGVQTGIDAPGTQTTGMQPTTRIPSHQVPGIHPDLKHQQQYRPSSTTPQQQFLPPSSMTHPREYGINGDIGRTQVPGLHPPTTIPGHPHSDRRDLTQTSHATLTDSTGPGTVRFDHTRNGLQYSGSSYQQPTKRGEYTGIGIPPLVSGIPGDSRDTPIIGVRPGDAQFLPRGAGPTSPEHTRRYQIPTLRPGPGGTVPGIPGDGRGTPIIGVRPGDVQFLPRGTGPISPEQTRGFQMPTSRQGSDGIVPESAIRDSRITSRGTTPTLIAPGDRRIVTDQFGRGSTGLYGEESAASQTQIQTGLEGTAAEASAAGQYRGLGSQTQVQGGYAGNGSFSAQAQSGFTGGVVQSQVQGSKLGGLSGSSAQVEHVGSAQSQVQVGQPSGAASSSAQGRFSGGITQVQAQSGKTGGSAGAQAQSTGLSSSNVQVNIGGNDVSEREKFQGTVSASVQGGHSSGQSQTQLQSGYESGRTYVATAQGGFDTSSGFQVSVPPMGSLTRLSNHTVGIRQPSGAISSQGPLHAVSGRPVVGSPAFRIPPGYDLDGKQKSETSGLKPRSSTVDQSIHTQTTVPQPGQMHLHSGRVPQQQFPVEVSSQRTLYLPSSQPGSIQGSRVQYPSLKSETQRPSHVLLSPQITGYPYPGYPTDVSGISTGTLDENQISGSSGIPGFRRYDQTGIQPPDITPGSQHAHASESSLYQGGALKPSTYLPGVIQGQLGSQYIQRITPEGTRDTSYPSSFVPSWGPTDQLYNDTTEIPPIYQDLSRQQPGTFSQIPYSPTLGLRQIPGYQTSLVPPKQRPDLTRDEMTGFRPSQLPGFQTGQYPIPSYYPGQPPIWLPSLQTTPSHIRPDEQSILTSPGAVPHFGLQPPPSSHIRPQQSGQVQPRPGDQSVLTSPGFGLQPLPSSHIRPQQPGQIQPLPDEQSVLTSHGTVPHFGLQPPPSSHIGPQQIGQIQPQTAPRVSTQTTNITHTGQPGVSEPDTRNCCEALRDLKRRCCGRNSKKDEGASCCKSASSDEIFDFSSEDDDSKGDEPCKIVKAICYIVYKPVGKARVCKPTQTNGC